ncbi:hypothetical protein AVEN_141365-1 [Araneus ventricosus]|uniref:Uncharacterized protein n=1 Tax=Araneus ventricosus TaxID=182803 RepID=A0A4Y2CY81_ARAVE|nr:hypothetical protein AVEN_141365-1 [Araneus ventricosus]
MSTQPVRLPYVASVRCSMGAALSMIHIPLTGLVAVMASGYGAWDGFPMSISNRLGCHEWPSDGEHGGALSHVTQPSWCCMHQGMGACGTASVHILSTPRFLCQWHQATGHGAWRLPVPCPLNRFGLVMASRLGAWGGGLHLSHVH